MHRNHEILLVTQLLKAVITNLMEFRIGHIKLEWGEIRYQQSAGAGSGNVTNYYRRYFFI